MADEIWKRPVYQSARLTTGLLDFSQNPAAPFPMQLFPNPEFRYRYFKPKAEPKAIAAKPYRTLAQDGARKAPACIPALPAHGVNGRPPANPIVGFIQMLPIRAIRAACVRVPRIAT